MKKSMLKKAIIMTALLLVPTISQFTLPIYQTTQIEAATKKPALVKKQIKTGIGTASQKIEIQNKLKDANYTFHTNNKKVATADKKGKVTGISEGFAVITVKQTYKNKVTTIGTCNVSIKAASIYSSLEKIECGINAEISLDHYIKIEYPNKKASYSYEVDKESVAAIQKEKLKGISVGSAVIHVYETDKGLKRELGSVPIVVKDITMEDLAIDPYYLIDGQFSRILYYDDIIENKTLDFKTTLVKTPSNASDYISYSTSDKNVALVDKNGIITAVGKGEATITAIWSNKKIELEVICISCLEEDGY